MSGHSKWSTIKRKKAATDAKKGAAFTKIARLIEVSAKGGADPETNFSLKLAVQKAREANMPQVNVEKAIRKGAGLDSDKSQIEEIVYEGIGPGNVGIIVQTLTDNKNRTVTDLRNIFNKNGGSLGNSGSVAWQFESKGQIYVEKNNHPDQELGLIEAGAVDVIDGGDVFEVHTDPKDLNAVRQNIAAAGMKVTDSKLALIPNSTVTIADLPQARKVLQLMDRLDENDDVSEVFTNFEIDDAIAVELE